MVIDLSGSNDEIMSYFHSSSGERGFPKYSIRYFEHILKEWSLTAPAFRQWFDKEYQVITKMAMSSSKWSITEQAKIFVISILFEIKHYFNHVTKNWALRLASMTVSPLEFLQRQSAYKTFCPCCLHYTGELITGGEPPDRTGLIQYNKYFYWLCANHVEIFLRHPDEYLPPYNSSHIPKEWPSVLENLSGIPENVAEDGLCVTCYKNDRKLEKGICNYAAKYSKKIFVFDSKICLDQFMKKPSEYVFTIGYKAIESYPSLQYKNLPVLGMLEQYMANPIIQALQYIASKRPLIPGLSISASALIAVGLFLKIHFTNVPDTYKLQYKKGVGLFRQRRKQLIKSLDDMKTSINPFLYYEEHRYFDSSQSNYSESFTYD